MNPKGAASNKWKTLVYVKIFLLVLLSLLVKTNAHHITQGDFDRDGDVDIRDFEIFTNNFGKEYANTTREIHQADTVWVVSIDTVRIGNQISYPDIHISSLNGFGNTNEETLKNVFGSVQHSLCKYLVYPYDSDILVSHNELGPKILFNRNSDGKYRMWIDSEHRRWAQQIYQFSHEYGHIMMNYSPYNRMKWFEESMAALASLYTLRDISKEWKTNPPTFSMNMYAVAGHIEWYWKDLESKTPYVNLTDLEFRNWFYRNEQALYENAYLRSLNRVVAWHLLDIFENDPESWNAVRYLNIWNVRSDNSIDSYLRNWYLVTPQKWQHVPLEIIRRFGRDIRSSKPAIDFEFENRPSSPVGPDR